VDRFILEQAEQTRQIKVCKNPLDNQEIGAIICVDKLEANHIPELKFDQEGNE
jgi:hypothetical protein